MIPEINPELQKVSKDIDDLKTPSNKILVRLLILGLVGSIGVIGWLAKDDKKHDKQDIIDCRIEVAALKLDIQNRNLIDKARDSADKAKIDSENERLKRLVAQQDSTKNELLKKIHSQ